jgi:hypothetical protein
MQTDFSAAMGRAMESVVMFVPLLIAFLIILVIGYVVAMALGKVVDKVLTRVGFDRMVERGGIKKVLSRSGYHVSDILGKITFYTLFLLVLQLAFGVFGPNPISDLLTALIAYLPRVFVAIVLVVIAAYVGQAVKEVVQASLGGLSYGRVLANMAAISIVVIGVFAALDHLGVARAIVVGLFYAILAIVVGVSVVAIGGAGIVPMRARWEAALNRIDREVPRMKETARAQNDEGSMQVVEQPPAPLVDDAAPPRPEADDGRGYVS